MDNFMSLFELNDLRERIAWAINVKKFKNTCKNTARAWRLYDKGLSMSEIASELGMSEKRVCHLLMIDCSDD